MKLPMILLWNAVVLEVGVRGCKHTPKSFDLLKIWVKSLKIRVYMAPSVLRLQKMAPRVCRKTHEDFTLEVTPKKELHDLCGRKFVGKIAQKTFRASLGKFGQKSFAVPKICLLLHLWWKGTSASIVPFWKGRGGNAPAIPPFCSRHTSTPYRRPCVCYSILSLLVVVGYNVSPKWAYQRSPNTKQFIPTKMSGNALKQGVEDTQCYVRAVHNCKIQGCANVSSNSSRSERMRLGWRTPRIDGLKLAKLHKNWEWA